MKAAHIKASQQRASPNSDFVWRFETLFVVVTGGLLLLLMTQPAFRSFFLGENFLYLGQYHTNNNNYWQAIWSPSDNIFFRPVFVALSLPWHFILHPDPLIYHTRNFLFSVFNLFLLHRVLLRLVVSRWARVLAVLLFAVSKVHLTTIGYINIYDSIIMLMLLLLTILFFLRYLQQRRELDYVLALFFAFLSIFSKDYGLVVIFVVASLIAFQGFIAGGWRTLTRFSLVRLSPLVLMAVFYLALRFTIVGPLPKDNPVYSPQLSSTVTITKTLAFTSAMGNLSLTGLRFTDTAATGASGLLSWLAQAQGGSKRLVSLIDLGCYVVFLGFLLGTVIMARRAWKALLFPLLWMAVYFGPSLLTRNLQMYYFYEGLAGTAVLVGLCLDRVHRSLLIVWSLLLVIIATNGIVSNYTSLYHWQHAAQMAQKIQKPVLEAHRGEQVNTITFVTASQPFWQWALSADTKGPMIPELMRLPDLKVNVVRPGDLPNNQPRPGEATLIFDIDQGFKELSTVAPSAKTPPVQQSFEKQVGTLTADPNPIRVCDGSALGMTNLSYTFPKGEVVELHVDSPTGPLFAAPVANGSALTGKWVTDGMVFFLQGVSDGRPLTVENSLASVKVRVTNAGCQ